MDNEFVKPSRLIHPGQDFQLKSESLWLTYQVKNLLPSRVKGSLVTEYLENKTTPEVLLKLDQIKRAKRAQLVKGLRGRPTKKERRTWAKWLKSR